MPSQIPKGSAPEELFSLELGHMVSHATPTEKMFRCMSSHFAELQDILSGNTTTLSLHGTTLPTSVSALYKLILIESQSSLTFPFLGSLIPHRTHQSPHI